MRAGKVLSEIWGQQSAVNSHLPFLESVVVSHFLTTIIPENKLLLSVSVYSVCVVVGWAPLGPTPPQHTQLQQKSLPKHPICAPLVEDSAHTLYIVLMVGPCICASPCNITCLPRTWRVLNSPKILEEPTCPTTVSIVSVS